MSLRSWTEGFAFSLCAFAIAGCAPDGEEAAAQEVVAESGLAETSSALTFLGTYRFFNVGRARCLNTSGTSLNAKPCGTSGIQYWDVSKVGELYPSYHPLVTIEVKNLCVTNGDSSVALTPCNPADESQPDQRWGMVPLPDGINYILVNLKDYGGPASGCLFSTALGTVFRKACSATDPAGFWRPTPVWL